MSKKGGKTRWETDVPSAAKYALPGGAGVKTGDEVKHWVSTIRSYSSEYDNCRWCAKQVIGPPKVYPKYGDIPGAWASKDINAFQYLELVFPEALFITEIEIYETYHAGGTKSIKALKPNGDWEEIWKTDRLTCIQQSRIFKPEIQQTTFRTDTLRVEIDCSAAGTWVEIDAVQITGRKFLLDSPPGLETLSADYEKVVGDKLFSDVQFDVDGYIIYGHRIILTARSDYFRAMFCDQMRESETRHPIKMTDVKKSSFLALMHYLYSNTVPDYYTCEELVSIWRVADRFSVAGLKLLCSSMISEKLDGSNVVDVYVESTSKLPVLEDLKKLCLSYMSSNMDTVSRSREFASLPQEIMLEIIQAATSKLKI